MKVVVMDGQSGRMGQLLSERAKAAALPFLMGTSGSAFTGAAFVSGAFVNAVPGIVLHILLLPVIVLALRKANIVD